VVLGTGEIVRCSRTERSDVFMAALVGVGAIGVVTEVTLRCVDAFILHADERPTPLADVLSSLDERVAGNDHLRCQIEPHPIVARPRRDRRVQRMIRPSKRRLGRQFWSAEDRDRALRLAEELDAQADELERAFSNESAAGPTAAQTPKVTQTQMQVQQGPPAEEAPAKDKGSDKPD